MGQRIGHLGDGKLEPFKDDLDSSCSVLCGILSHRLLYAVDAPQLWRLSALLWHFFRNLFLHLGVTVFLYEKENRDDESESAGAELITDNKQTLLPVIMLSIKISIFPKFIWEIYLFCIILYYFILLQKEN